MRHGIAFLLVCFLAFTRMVGLHQHACAGLEAGIAHAGTHLADNGFLFGEHHVEDDGDDREIEPLTLAASNFQFDLSDLDTPVPSNPLLVPVAKLLLTVAAPRGPPSALPSHLPHFSPPLRGPPSHSLA